MGSHEPEDNRTPQEIVRGVVDLCADCDSCRPLMDEVCMFFPELYRLWDQEKEHGVPASGADLRHLVNLCTLCGLCPCPKIPSELMEAKSRYIRTEGLPIMTRALADVPLMGRLCGTCPALVDALQENKVLGPLLRRMTHIHTDRKLPSFPQQNFFQWARQNGLTGRNAGSSNVAYFAGCTAGYLFPEIGKSLVAVLKRNGLAVYVPPQQCCGMPQLVEGDRDATLRQTQFNMEHLLEASEAGDDLICSCPSCGYFIKVLLRDRACYSEAYQRAVKAGKDQIKVPILREDGRTFRTLKKSMYKDILKDDGYFSALDPLRRMELSEKVFDAGEFLLHLHANGRLDTGFKAIRERIVYFAPCHQREQKMGYPYLELLRLIPGITVEQVGGEMDCCGMGGNFGFKEDFHDKSLVIGRPLLEKIQNLSPQSIVTDCMSCRLQFSHSLPYPVFHPIEILASAYQADAAEDAG